MNSITNAIYDLAYKVTNRLSLNMETAKLNRLLSKAISVGENNDIHPPAHIVNPQKLQIGSCVKIQHNLFVYCGGGLQIDDGVAIGRNCRIVTSHHELDELDALPFGSKFIYQKVHICRFATLMMDVIVLPGVTIGEGAVVGAGSVVSKDIPPLAVAAGVPARVLRYRDRETYDRLVNDQYKRAQYLQGVMMPRKKLRRLVEKYEKMCRERLKTDGVFTLTDDNCDIEPILRGKTLYHIAMRNPGLEMVEVGEFYGLRKIPEIKSDS